MALRIPVMTDLDASQRNVVQHSPYDDSIFVNGPPGSGKTHISILRTQVLINNGYTQVLFLLYNHSMYGFLKTIFNKLNFARNLEVNTKDKFLWNLANKNDFTYNSNNEPYEQKYQKALNHLKQKTLRTRYQVIVIDECQDFSDDEMDVLRKLSSNIIAVGDLDQSVYQIRPSSFFKTLRSFNLSTIYRYGPRIAELAQPFSTTHNQMVRQVTKTDNTNAFKISTKGGDDEFDKIAILLNSKRYIDETVAILAPTRESLKTLLYELKARNVNCYLADSNDLMREYNFDSKTPILITPFSSKGMEFDCVLLYDYNYALQRRQNFEKILFVSITRTSRELYLIENSSTVSALRNLPGWVEKDTEKKADDDYEF